MGMKDDLQKAGLSRIDIVDVERIEKILGGNNILTRLIIKAYNQGFKKGLKKALILLTATIKGLVIDYV